MDVLVNLNGYDLTYFEFFSFLFTLVAIYMNTKQLIWAWPIGMVGIVLAGILYWHSHLYANFLLQIFFFSSSVYGWYQWLFGGDNQSQLRVSRLSKRGIIQTGLVFVVIWPLSGLFFSHVSDIWAGAPPSPAPFTDAFVSVLSVIAQIFLTRKILESWHIWIAVNIVANGLFFTQGLYLMALLYGILIFIAILGLKEWHASWKKHPQMG